MNKLITKCLSLGKADLLINFNMELLNVIERKMVTWIAEYMSHFSEPPSLSRFKLEFPSFIEIHSKSPIEDIYNVELKAKKNLYFRQVVSEAESDILDGIDPTELVERLSRSLASPTTAMVSSKTLDRSYYFDSPEIIPFFIPFVDRNAGGLAKGDLVWITGRPGSKKTTLLESTLIKWVLCGKSVLYISNENSYDAVMPKLDAFVSGFNPISYRLGTWTEETKELVHAAHYLFSKLSGSVEILIDPIQTTAEIAALIRAKKPDIVVIDGTYLMSEKRNMGGDWKDQAEISRNLKKVARKTHTPIVGVIQASRSAEGTLVKRDMLAGTDAYLQDGDTIISVNVIDGVSVGQVVKSRWGPTPYGQTFQFHVNFDTMLAETKEVEALPVKLEEDEEW